MGIEEPRRKLMARLAERGIDPEVVGERVKPVRKRSRDWDYLCLQSPEVAASAKDAGDGMGEEE